MKKHHTLDLLAAVKRANPELSERQLSIRLGYSDMAIQMGKKRGSLSPVMAGQLAEMIGENASEWIALAALESPLPCDRPPESKSHMQASMKKHHTLMAPEDLVERFDKLPLTRSAAITQAILNVEREPELLAQAFRLRLHQPYEENGVRVAYTRDTRIDETLKKLTDMAKLPGEQVVRLCMEAYIYKL